VGTTTLGIPAVAATALGVPATGLGVPAVPSRSQGSADDDTLVQRRSDLLDGGRGRSNTEFQAHP
jgi:hypothetical protein